MTPEFLLGARLALHAATAVILLSYCRPRARFRLGPSVMAGLLASSSAALTVQIATDWHEMLSHSHNPALLMLVFAVFLPVAATKGDTAKLYDAMRLLPRPFWR